MLQTTPSTEFSVLKERCPIAWELVRFAVALEIPRVLAWMISGSAW